MTSIIDINSPIGTGLPEGVVGGNGCAIADIASNKSKAGISILCFFMKIDLRISN